MATTPDTGHRFRVICGRCDGVMLARPAWVGRDVQCPHCSCALRVPPAPAGEEAVRAKQAPAGHLDHFAFACPRCDSLLEAHTGMSAQPGSCPTCGVQLIVPHLDPASGMPEDPIVLDDDRQDPTPMHAYAASGVAAPEIVRGDDDEAYIRCPRCKTLNDVDTNNCTQCNAPFSIEGAPTRRAGQRESLATAALVLGILGLPLWLIFVPGALALVFGLWAARGGDNSKTTITGLVAAALGLCSVTLGVISYL